MLVTRRNLGIESVRSKRNKSTAAQAVVMQ